MKKHGRICGSRCLGPMQFLSEPKGQLVTVCQGGCLASRDTSSSKHGLVFLLRPVKLMEKIRIRIENGVSSWDGALRIGFTNNHPNGNLIPPTALPDMLDTPRCCVVPVPVEACLPCAEIEFWLNYAALVLIREANGKKYCMKAKTLNLNEPLYVFLDLYGNTSAVRLLGSRKGARTSCPSCPRDPLLFKGQTDSDATKVSDTQRLLREGSLWQGWSAPSHVISPQSTQGPDATKYTQTPTNRSPQNRNLQSLKEEMDVTFLIRKFQRQHLSSSKVHMIIWRKQLLKSTIHVFSNSNFPWTKTPHIEFVGEEAFDNGGPTREFFRLLMIEVQSSLGIFEGRPGHLFFTYDQSALQHHKYKQAGKLVAWSVAHGGPGLKALDPCLYQLMCGQETQLTGFDWRLIPDADVQAKVQKILSCKTSQDLRALQRDLGDWICDCGFPGIYGPKISIQDLPDIYSYVVRHYIYLRVSNMVVQFTEGLNLCGGLWDTVKANWIDFLPIFTNMSEPISRATFRALFQINWSREGTKCREEEEETIYYWELVLKMIEDKETELCFQELLVFITAADDVPALGFPQKPTINFYQPERLGRRLPYASTCMMGLFLPRAVKGQAELNAMLLQAVRDSAGFGKT
ncbi:uncharacterized protein LOC143490355 [Brachyhypopomus gauderio]|uniref:uncharacterized protein LOC143490355 n=1 Tax=Brachyhypopomus gauderio TaxID=698409 RepID=UPI004042B906